LESVLKAVGDAGSTSDFSAVEDFPKVWAVTGAFICRDNLGRLGGDEFDGERVMTDEYCLAGAIIIQ
jgi:hypothetical protein